MTAGIPITRDALIASAGIDLLVLSAASLSVSNTGQAGSQAEDHAVKGTVTDRF